MFDEKNMRILQVIDQLEIGGAERVFVDMSNILFENDEKITVLFLRKGGELEGDLNPAIRRIALDRSVKWNIMKMHECAQYMKKYDIIHCHFRHVYRYIQLINSLFSLRKKVILHDHYGSIEIDKKIPKFFDSWLKPHYYIGVSTTLTNWAVSHLKIQRESVFLLQNIINKKTDKKDYPFHDLILVSNFKRVKNNLFAINLAKRLNKSLLLVGQNQDTEYTMKIKMAVKESEISIDSEIHDIQPLLNNFRLGLHTSKSESGPLVLIEYLGQNLPFLAYKTGEVAEKLNKYFPEFFMDNLDEEKWIKRINELFEKPLDEKKMQKVFHLYFGKREYFNKLMKLYQWIENS